MRYAVRNLIRLKARSFLTFMLAFAVLFLSMFGVMAVRLCEDNRERFYGPLDGSVRVTNDRYEPYLTYDAAMTICEDAQTITKVSALKEYTGFFYDTTYVGWDDFMRDAYSQEVPIKTEGEALTEEDKRIHYRKSMTIIGVTSMDILEEVYGGDLRMTAGTMITESNHASRHNKIVISRELAEQNDFSIGDTVALNMPSLYRTEYEMGFLMNHENNAEDSYVYVIGGIYENRVDNTASASVPWELNANRVYVPLSTLAEISESERIRTLYSYVTRQTQGMVVDRYRSINVNPSTVPDRLYFHLSDLGEHSALCEEINALGFHERVLLTEYVSDSASSPSVRLSGIVSAVLIGIDAVGFLIFCLVILFNMKARHRELAVLVALGKRRSAITVSFFMEISLLIGLAFLSSGVVLTFALRALAVPITRYLYSSEVSARFHDETSNQILFGNITESNVLEQMMDRGYLFRGYALPSFMLIFAGTVILMGLLGLFIRIYVQRINALSDVGGKE